MSFGRRNPACKACNATTIFGKVGIKLSWVVGLTAREAIAHPVGEPWNPANLDVRIWTAAKARGPAVPSNALAYRLSVEQGQAVLLSDAIQNLAEIWGMDNADLLGVAMAHEIGHLLLHTSGHSNVGHNGSSLSSDGKASPLLGEPEVYTHTRSNELQSNVGGGLDVEPRFFPGFRSMERSVS